MARRCTCGRIAAERSARHVRFHCPRHGPTTPREAQVRNAWWQQRQHRKVSA